MVSFFYLDVLDILEVWLDVFRGDLDEFLGRDTQ